MITARCPYYKYQEHWSVCCDGPASRMAVRMCFFSDADRRMYQKRFCRSDFEKCFLCGALTDAYEKGAGEEWFV